MNNVGGEGRFLGLPHGTIPAAVTTNKTSSPQGNDRSPDNKSSKYFEQFSSERFINWSRAANSAVHGWIRPNFKLFQDYTVVLGSCKNEEDPTNLQNEGARVLTSLYMDFSDAQGQPTPKSVVEFLQTLFSRY